MPELFAADGQPFSFLGVSVAVSGDMVVVGAPGIDDGQGDDVPVTPRCMSISERLDQAGLSLKRC